VRLKKKEWIRVAFMAGAADISLGELVKHLSDCEKCVFGKAVDTEKRRTYHAIRNAYVEKF